MAKLLVRFDVSSPVQSSFAIDDRVMGACRAAGCDTIAPAVPSSIARYRLSERVASPRHVQGLGCWAWLARSSAWLSPEATASLCELNAVGQSSKTVEIDQRRRILSAFKGLGSHPQQPTEKHEAAHLQPADHAGFVIACGPSAMGRSATAGLATAYGHALA